MVVVRADAATVGMEVMVARRRRRRKGREERERSGEEGRDMSLEEGEEGWFARWGCWLLVVSWWSCIQCVGWLYPRTGRREA